MARKRDTESPERNSVRESERFLNSWVFECISNPWIWTPETQDGFGPNPNPILLSYPNKGFRFGPPQIQIQIQIHVIQIQIQY